MALSVEFLDRDVTTQREQISQKLSADLSHLESDLLWTHLVNKGAAIGSKMDSSTPLVAMEVGMHNAKQCVEAAEKGMEVHCIEPSPKSFTRVQVQVAAKKSSEIMSRTHLYNMAAGSSSEGTVPFYGSGGTGDHVGDFDMWSMKEGGGIAKDVPAHKQTTLTNVNNVKLDDIVLHNRKIVPTSKTSPSQFDEVFVLKVDTQGFEPAVFSGLTEAIAQKKIKYLLFEYWPKGMDLLASTKDKCSVSTAILNRLAKAGYTLYALSSHSHPKAPVDAKLFINSKNNGRPMENFELNCQWYYDVEKKFPSDEYNMGYWSDFLAVSPNAEAVRRSEVHK